MIDCCSVKSKDMRHCKEIRYYALKTTAATSPLIVRYLLLKISFHDWLQNICAVKVVEFWHKWSAWNSFSLPPSPPSFGLCFFLIRQVTWRDGKSLWHKHEEEMLVTITVFPKQLLHLCTSRAQWTPEFFSTCPVNFNGTWAGGFISRPCPKCTWSAILKISLLWTQMSKIQKSTPFVVNSKMFGDVSAILPEAYLEYQQTLCKRNRNSSVRICIAIFYGVSE